MRALVKRPGQEPEVQDVTFDNVRELCEGFICEVHAKITPSWLWLFVNEDAALMGERFGLNLQVPAAAILGGSQAIRGTVVALKRKGRSYTDLDDETEAAARVWLADHAL